MEDIRTSVRVTVHTLSTSVRSRSFIAQKASYWCNKDTPPDWMPVCNMNAGFDAGPVQISDSFLILVSSCFFFSSCCAFPFLFWLPDSLNGFISHVIIVFTFQVTCIRPINSAIIPESMAFNITSSADRAQCLICFGCDVTLWLRIKAIRYPKSLILAASQR